jgi:hypothetical protein
VVRRLFLRSRSFVDLAAKEDDDNNEEDDENGEQDESDEHDGYSE